MKDTFLKKMLAIAVLGISLTALPLLVSGAETGTGTNKTANLYATNSITLRGATITTWQGLTNNLAPFYATGTPVYVETDPAWKAGGVMTGPVTNTVGYYGNGVGLTNTAWNNASNAVISATNNLNVRLSVTETNALKLTGGVMTGPVTNTAGYYGNGAGLTNIPSSGVVLTNYSTLTGGAITNPVGANVNGNNKAFTNIALVGFTNATTMNCGTLGGTNGVYFYNPSNGSNYWILLP